MDNSTRNELRSLLRDREWFQKARVNTSNRMEIKKSGEKMKNFGNAMISEESIPAMIEINERCRHVENDIEAKITKIVKKDRMWNGFFKDIPGIGPIGAAYLLAEIDIYEGSTRARIWQYCGLNPGMILGKKVDPETGKTYVTGELIRGDKKTNGFKCPYNQTLKPKLYKVIAEGIIKASGRSSKPNRYYEVYMNRKQRMSQSENSVGDSDRIWKDESKAHINQDAIRFMLKELLSDFYEVYRAQEGLEVRVRYEQEYLGRKHHF